MASQRFQPVDGLLWQMLKSELINFCHLAWSWWPPPSDLTTLPMFAVREPEVPTGSATSVPAPEMDERKLQSDGNTARIQITHKWNLCSCLSGLIRTHNGVVKCTHFGYGHNWFQSQLPPISHMTLGVLLHQARPQFPYLLSGDNNCVVGLLTRLKKIT